MKSTRLALRNVLLRSSWHDLAALALTLVSFVVFFVFRQREIGGTDEWGYYSQAKWLLGNDPVPTTGLDPTVFPALAPHFWKPVGHSLVPFFPPGFPLLLAIADKLGLLFAVPALLGAATVWLAYLLARREIGGDGALVLAVAWVTTPIVLWGATHLMSDLAAAAGALGAYYLIRSDRPGWGGILTALSILVRPSNVAFGVVMATLGTRGKGRWRYVLASALGVAVLVAVLWHRYGALSRIGYVDNFVVLRTLVPSQLAFLLQETWRGAWPLLLLSIVAIVRNPARALVPGIWFLAFLLPYSTWPFPYDGWWWVRYLLPALPALLDLGAIGLRELRESTRYGGQAAVALLAVASASMCLQNERLGALTSANDEQWRARATIVGANTPPNALIGARGLASAVRIYAERATFQPFRPRAFALVRFALERQQPVYLVEDENATPGLSFAEWYRNFSLEPVTDIPPSEHLWRVRRLP